MTPQGHGCDDRSGGYSAKGSSFRLLPQDKVPVKAGLVANGRLVGGGVMLSHLSLSDRLACTFKGVNSPSVGTPNETLAPPYPFGTVHPTAAMAMAAIPPFAAKSSPHLGGARSPRISKFIEPC